MIETPVFNTSSIRLSLIVATLNRREELTALLRSIPPNLGSKLEIVIVDQNQETLQQQLAAFAHTFRLLHVPVVFRNANQARNLGVTTSHGEWLMFPDDDAMFLPNTLERILEMINTDTFDLMSGPIVDNNGTPHLLKWLPDAAKITPKTLEHTLVESSFCIRKALFLSVGGFDVRFGPGSIFPSAEGADLIYRLWRRGPVRTCYDPAMALYHLDKSDPVVGTSCRRIHDFALGEGAFTARHYKRLPLLTIARKLLFRLAGTCLCRGERRHRKVAFLTGFFKGAYRYCMLPTNSAESVTFPKRGAI